MLPPDRPTESPLAAIRVRSSVRSFALGCHRFIKLESAERVSGRDVGAKSDSQPETLAGWVG